jgi:hypothetical protein
MVLFFLMAFQKKAVNTKRKAGGGSHKPITGQ